MLAGVIAMVGAGNTSVDAVDAEEPPDVDPGGGDDSIVTLLLLPEDWLEEVVVLEDFVVFCRASDSASVVG